MFFCDLTSLRPLYTGKGGGGAGRIQKLQTLKMSPNEGGSTTALASLGGEGRDGWCFTCRMAVIDNQVVWHDDFATCFCNISSNSVGQNDWMCYRLLEVVVLTTQQ